jgi:hypothetical protein
MADRQTQSWSRREFLAGLTAMGRAGVLQTRPAAAELAPETTRLRLSQVAGICLAPQYVAQELLQAEGFTDIRYVNIPEDTVRFYSLRLREVGLVKSSPQKLIAQGTDWRFLNELKKELKG